jgi:tRNA-splicing ligase RtcB (3'-phosphate/5'-hydroxy nucleic acid ligase)
MSNKFGLVQIDDYRWELPPVQGMRVPGRIYASKKLVEETLEEESVRQTGNVAFLPGIVKYSLAMPDIHSGYGFPIGGVAAMDPEAGGVISPGGIGYDINCGVRLLRSNLHVDEIKDRLKDLVAALFRDVPAGLGARGGGKVNLRRDPGPMVKGSQWAVEQGYGSADDVEHTEERGRLRGADPDKVSQRAIERGEGQVGSLGSGNHFLEIGFVETIYQTKAADAFGLWPEQVYVFIHSGSRGFGHQVCTDYLRTLAEVVRREGLFIPDRQLVCAPIHSAEGRDYMAAMACAANYAWANRQRLTHLAREAIGHKLKMEPRDLGLELVYDVAHNIAKFEKHTVDGEEKELCVHRKGATRAFPAGHPDLPHDYRPVGQPVLIPGDMGTASYVLVGTERAMAETWGTTCHGAGRVMSRHAAIARAKGRDIQRELAEKGIYVLAEGREALAEEMSEAYKDVDEVVRVVHEAGLAERVARLRPLGVVKG